MLEERRQRIAEGLANADKIKQELANAQAKAQEDSDPGQRAGEQVHRGSPRRRRRKSRKQETQKAIAAANDIVAKARQANEAELARMKAELRKEVGRLVVATTAKVTGKILTPGRAEPSGGGDATRAIGGARLTVAIARPTE